MEEHQFRRLLELFPVVRSSTYCAEDAENSSATSDNAATSGRSRISATKSVMKDGAIMEKGSSADENESLEMQAQKSVASVPPGQGFWSPLRSAMQALLGDEEGQRFCENFKHVHESLVRETLSLDDIERIATHLKLRSQ
ncbi:hypothetical protein Mapa_009314 [Marchantia paleacea]|nr:hypothetical protein Mapa_009314 [Marchantia paleacea]